MVHAVKRCAAAAGFVVIVVAVGANAQDVGPTRDSLLAAWETAQREDPQTMHFEKIEAGRYAFATERFPFDGVVRVLNLVIDESTVEYPPSMVMGVVEADLEGVDDEFRRQHAYSIGLWQAANTLYFDADNGRWLTSAQWQRSMVDRYASPGWIARLAGSFWVIFLVIFVIVLWWITRRAGRQFKTATAAQDKALAEQERAIRLTEEALQISRDSNRLLSEILDAIKRGDHGAED